MRLLISLFAMIWALGAKADPQVEAASLAAYDEIPAAVVGWARGDSISWASYGLRTIGGDPVQDGDPWHIGSLTKSMTAVLAARLVQSGLISWDSTIGEVLGHIGPYQEVTLEMLLRHSAGLPANMALPDVPRGDYVSAALAGVPAEPIGGFLYSNAGYTVAGVMLETAAGTPWEELIATEVGLRPVGQGREADNIAAISPAGRVHLNAEDMLHYLQAHLTRDPGFLDPEHWERLHAVQGPGNYALGWIGAGPSLIHDGSNTFWYALAAMNFDTGVAGFVALNSGELDVVQAPAFAALRRVMTSAD